MNNKVRIFQTEFNSIIDESQRLCYISRAKELQLEACEKLKNLKQKACILKEEMIANGDEDSANALLSFEEIIKAFINDLNMWVALKNDDPNSAWDYLINAQDAARNAVQAHEIGNLPTGYIERLQALEHLLFPPQLFLSTGMVIGRSECSICGQEYGECNHIKGKSYMGKKCVRIIKEVKEMKEVSIVDEPADKRCRVFQFTEGDVTRDLMTWRIIH